MNHTIASSSDGGENTAIVSQNRTDEENCISFLSYMLKGFEVNSKSVFISSGEKKLGTILVSSIKRELELNHISCIDQKKESINESRVAIVVFSPKYPESEKCLDELVEIKKRMDEGGLDVLPVSYELNHETVKELNGCFLNRLLKIEHKVRQFVDRSDENSILETEARIWGWRQAILSISSRPEVSYRHRNIVEFIDDIVKDVKELMHKKTQKPIVAKPLTLPQETIFYTLKSLLHALNYEISDIECFTEMPHGFVSLKLKRNVSLVFFNLTCQDTLLLIQRIAALQYFKERMMTRDA